MSDEEKEVYRAAVAIYASAIQLPNFPEAKSKESARAEVMQNCVADAAKLLGILQHAIDHTE